MIKSLQIDRLQLGVCYYPEHWPEELWADDFRRMRELGLTVVRMAEFAWTIFEPEEGHFSFDLFDRALNLAQAHGLNVIMCTPTATPPAWLTHAYPETLNVSQSGVPYRHGQRRHYNYNAPIYRELSARIVRQLAEQYGRHPAVIGWQIDNELNCEVNVFYSAADHAAFRAWVRQKYGTLEQLNRAWGTVFWNQTYTAWEQIALSGPTPSDSPNPHQALDEKRFFSDSAIGFAELQAGILRELAPGQWITTNGLFGHLDNHQLTESALDFISYDSYPNFSTLVDPVVSDAELQLDRWWSWNLSGARDISARFCVMEQQSGPGGWTNRMAQPAPKPGQMRLWTYQSIAHGADLVVYFRWRTATMGTEIYWHGINDYHNQPNRRVAEVRQIGRELALIGEQVAAAAPTTQVAILKDYENEWDGELDSWHGPYTRQSVHAWFAALQRRHIPCDAFNLRATTTLEELAHYQAVIYPHPAIMSDATAELLAAYVRQGGTVVFGARTGYKDPSGQCYMRPLPGPAAGLCGVTVADYTRIGARETAPPLRWRNGNEAVISADAFNDILQVEARSVTVLAEYAGGYYAGEAALTRNHVGAGRAYYYGAVFNLAAANALIDELGLRSPVTGILDLPPEIELAIRANGANGERILFLLNYSATAQQARLHGPAIDLLSGETVAGALEFAPYAVRVLAV